MPTFSSIFTVITSMIRHASAGAAYLLALGIDVGVRVVVRMPFTTCLHWSVRTHTGLTSFSARWLYVNVIRCVRVAYRTMGTPTVMSGHTPLGIFLVGDRLKMAWIYAMTDST